MFWFSVNCYGEIGLKVDIGPGAEVDVEGEVFVGRGYIPGH